MLTFDQVRVIAGEIVSLSELILSIAWALMDHFSGNHIGGVFWFRPIDASPPRSRKDLISSSIPLDVILFLFDNSLCLLREICDDAGL